MRPPVYVDTCAIIPLLGQGRDSKALRAIFGGTLVASSRLTEVETISVLRRMRLNNDIGEAAHTEMVELFLRRWASVRTIGLHDQVMARAHVVADATGARSLDAIHVASVLVYQEEQAVTLQVLSPDAGLRRAAAAMGLRVGSPG